MTTPNEPPAPEVAALAERLRELREREFRRLTQAELGQALRETGGAASPATVSMWENSASGRIVPAIRIEGYARLFCTARSFSGDTRMLDVGEFSESELDRFNELKQELLDLRDAAVASQDEASASSARSMWHFPDRSRVTLASYRLPADSRPAHADRQDLNYVRLAELADLDTLLDIYGEVRAANPASRVIVTAAQDMRQRDVANHLVLIGGWSLEAVAPWFTWISRIPIEFADPAEHEAVTVHDPERGEQEFRYILSDGQLVEDVGFFVRGPNPFAPKRTLTICGGITTRGVHGAARCFIDQELRQRNEEYILRRFPEGSTYCIVMKVPVVNQDPLTPDLSRDENRLFEWYDANPMED